MKKIVFFAVAGILFISACIFLTRPPDEISTRPRWGIAFSKPFAIRLGLDWRETYIAALDELKPTFLRLPVYWEDIEPEQERFVYDDYDWMIKEANRRNIRLVLTVGRKLPRWPECHVPAWAVSLNERVQQERVKTVLSKIVDRYMQTKNLSMWQVENEPFLSFGKCPPLDTHFLEEEISLVRSRDPRHPVMLTDSGELSIWLRAASRADVFGTTMYRVIWNDYIGYIHYPFPYKFFWIKANIVHFLYPKKPIIVSELQAEPWGPKLIHEISLEEQEKSMNLQQFRENIAYAQNVGFKEIYLWGTEWWYWMKIKHDRPEFWEEARRVMETTESVY